MVTISACGLRAPFMTDKVREADSVQIRSDYRRNCEKFRSETKKQDCKERLSGALIDFPCAPVDCQIHQLHGMIKAAYYFPTKSNLSSDLTTVNKALTFQPSFRFRRGASPALAAAF